MPDDRPAKAYHLRARHESDHVRERVVFAPTAKLARTYGLEDVAYIDTTATRAPAFDRYAPGPVPIRALMEAGWWFQCGGVCHRPVRIWGDAPEDADVIIAGEDVYCGPVCEAHDAGDARGHRFARAEIVAAETEVARRWPTAQALHAYWNRSAYGQPPPPDGWRIFVRVRCADGTYGTWWEGDATILRDDDASAVVAS